VHNVLSHLVHCAKAADVELAMVDGRILMENREVLGLDEARLLREGQEAGRRLVSRLQ
jgi:5-methylthioadenosine/S-adenosylhomocysteine deaminase